MERDLLLCALLPLVCWPVLTTLALARHAPPPVTPSEDASGVERTAWLHLWAGVLPGVCAAALLVGWALVEPDPSDERLGGWRLLLSVLCAIPFLRAAVRSVVALVRPAPLPVVGTRGLLQPSTFVDPDFASSVSPAILDAAMAHERAHAAHRDPLRLWLAQVATDLQWPVPSAPGRLERWRQALEWARDDDARAAGVAGEDLAEAIVLAVRAQQGATRGIALANAGIDLQVRVRRLLAPAPTRKVASRLPLWPLAAVVAAGFVGIEWGEPIVRLLVGAH